MKKRRRKNVINYEEKTNLKEKIAKLLPKMKKKINKKKKQKRKKVSMFWNNKFL